ncbi:hypothetical protein [Mesorhizobium sp. 128a]
MSNEQFEAIRAHLAKHAGKERATFSIAGIKALLDAADEAAWRPTHRHVKRGGAYRLIGAAKLQTSVPLADLDAMVVYQAEDGSLWVRPHVEFFDGRFEAIEAA